LRRQVLNGELQPGAHFLVQQLADMLQISRTPLREALIRLEEDGLVEVVPRHGIRIAQLSIPDMDEIYMILIGLEPIAAALVAERGCSEAEMETLISSTQEMEERLEKGDIENWARADALFHLTIVRACGNKRLGDIILKCWDQVTRARMFTLRVRGPYQPRQSAVEHRQVIEAIQNKDPERAAEVFRTHRTRGGREQIEILRELGINQF